MGTVFSSNIIRGPIGFLAALLAVGATPVLHGAGNGHAQAPAPLMTDLSPEPVEVAPLDAWRFAETFAAGRSDCEVVVGRGNSMLPLYRDSTVLVLERMDMSTLRAGMTVVFIGDSGRPVAHTLVEKTARGWRAAGVASRQRDQTFIQSRNYIGTVVRAYTPNAAIPSVASPRYAAETSAAAAGDQ